MENPIETFDFGDFVEDTGVRVGIWAKFISLDNLADCLNLKKRHHADLLYAEARTMGFDDEDAKKIVFRRSGMEYPAHYEFEEIKRRDNHGR